MSTVHMIPIQRPIVRWGIRIVWLSLVAIVFFSTLPIWRNALSLFVEELTVEFTTAATDPADFGLSIEFFALYRLVIVAFIGLFAMSAGILIFVRRSDDWMVVLTASYLVATGFNFSPVDAMLTIDLSLQSFAIRTITISSYLFLYLFLLLFPDGRAYPRWGWWLVISVLLSESLRYYLATISQDIDIILLLLVVLTFVPIGIAAISQFRRYRRMKYPVQRQQMKWLVFGGVIMTAGILVTILSLIPAYIVGGLPFIVVQLVILPIFAYGGTMVFITALVFSVLRYGLMQVDVVVNRSVVFALLTLVLGGIFVGALFALDRVFLTVTGQSQPTLVTTGAALLIGALFNPLRQQMQLWADRYIFKRNTAENHFVTLAGNTFGSYQIIGRIGEGGMATVYKARQPTTREIVAIKVLPEELSNDMTYRKRFLREGRVVTEMQHPNIVRVFNFGTLNASGQIDLNGSTYYIVMEYLEGISLATYLKKHGILTLNEALPILEGVARALDYAHERGVVHRDIKPDNVMLQLADKNMRVVLMDFGITKVLGDHETTTNNLTQTGLIGTIEYIAPEQIEGREITPATDIYALGVMTYQMLTGQLPFKGSMAELLFAHVQKMPPNPHDINPDISDTLGFMILRALSKDPDDRYSNAQDFIDSLRMAQ